MKQSKAKFTLCLHRTRAVWQNTIEVNNQWCCLHRMLCIKSPTENYCHVLFMTYWHKFQIIFNGHFIASSVGRQGAHQGQHFRRAEYCVRCRHGVLSRRNKATSAFDRRPSAPWVLSSAGKLIRYLHRCYFLPYQTFSSSSFFSPFLSFVTRLGCSLNALSFISWVDTPLTADWLQVVLVLGPDSVF